MSNWQVLYSLSIAREFEHRRKMISKSFHHQLKLSDRQPLVGEEDPPSTVNLGTADITMAFVTIITRDLKIDDAANLDGAVLKCMNKKSFLKCGNCNKRLKFILVACKQFCLAKRCSICCKMDFQNTSHVVAFIAVAQGTL